MNAQALHEEYCRLTAGTAKLAVWEQAWYHFEKAGYTQDDLRCYIQYLQRENKRMSSARYSLALHKFLDSEMKYFDSMLSLARASERNRRPAQTPKDQALAQLRPVVCENVEHSNVIPLKEALKKAIGNL